MKRIKNKTIAGLLAAVMLCTAINFTAAAEEQTFQTGKIESLVKGHYYDENNEMVRDAYIRIGEKHYYFDADGALVKPVRGNNLQVSHELMEVNGEYLFVEYTGNIFMRKGWVQAMDGRFPDDDEPYWFFRMEDGSFVTAKDSTEPRVKMLAGKRYAFDENGHMLYNQRIETQDGTYYALNSSNGELANSRWLYIEGDWYYFGENGLMPPDPTANSPYLEVKEVQLEYTGSLEVEVGKSVTIPISFTVASNSNADSDRSIETDQVLISDEELKGEEAESTLGNQILLAMAKTFRNGREAVDETYYAGEKAGKALREAYDFRISVTNTVDSGQWKGDWERGYEYDSSKGTIKLSRNIPCKVDIYFEMDGIMSEPLSITFVRKEDSSEKDTKDNVSILMEEQPKVVVEELKNLNKENLIKVLQNNEDNIVNKIASVEQDYTVEYNIGLTNQVNPKLANEFDSSKIKTVGAAMNAEADSDVVFHMNTSDEEIDTSSIVSEKKISIDLSLEINGTAVNNLEIPIVITMPIPESIDPDGVEVYHYHEGQRSKLDTKVNKELNTVMFTTDKFSTFLFAGNEKKSGGGSQGGDMSDSSSSSSSSDGSSKGKTDPLETAGTWIQDETGWWFKKADGSYPLSAWIMNGGNWFRFDDKGYMVTGWFTDAAGKRFYLNPISDGTKGVMKTGWQKIDGNWYYFNQASDGTKGALLMNTTTPDGYSVNTDGVWIP